MGLLKNEYKSFLDDIEKNMKSKEDLEYVKGRFLTFLDIVLDQMDHIMNFKKEEIDKLENTQKDLDERIKKMQQEIDNIEKDIYVEDGFDFEIVCPYCTHEFIVDLDENKSEIGCPECENIIELDWTGDIDDEQEQEQSNHGCQGGCCGGNNHGCPKLDNNTVKDEEDDDM